MTEHNHSPIIAFLAPEIPALSATFVYEELLGLELRGVTVVPVSVHRPYQPALGQEALAARVRYLYDGHKAALALSGLLKLPFFRGSPRALTWLVADLIACGPFRPTTWKLAFQFLVAVRLAGILKAEGCRHLHVHFAHVPAQIAMYAAAMVGIPFTIMAHANDIFERGLLLGRKAQRATRMLTISEYNRTYLKGIGVDPAKLGILRCGVSFSPRQSETTWQSRNLYRIGTLGRLVEKKGMDVLISALAELRSCPYRVELSIAGDGPLRGELERLVVDLSLKDMVHFEGNMPHRQVQTWMQGIDVFVLACKRDANGDMDGIPVVLMEAMSQSVPVVSTLLSGIPELVIDGRTGLLSEPGDVVGLANCIDQLLNKPDLRRVLVENAVRHVHSEFGQEVNLDRLLSYIGSEHLPLSPRGEIGDRQ